MSHKRNKRMNEIRHKFAKLKRSMIDKAKKIKCIVTPKKRKDTKEPPFILTDRKPIFGFSDFAILTIVCVFVIYILFFFAKIVILDFPN